MNQLKGPYKYLILVGLSFSGNLNSNCILNQTDLPSPLSPTPQNHNYTSAYDASMTSGYTSLFNKVT